MYRCFHCGEDTVVWNSDFSFDECGIVMEDDDGNLLDGIVHYCSCSNCGAEIEYRVPIFSEDEEEKEEK